MIFENRDQRWNITGVVSNDGYTAIFCDITILSNRRGCFDAHELDEKHLFIFQARLESINLCDQSLKVITTHGTDIIK